MMKTRDKYTSNIKFNGGRLVDHPINTEIDVGAVAPWIRTIPTHPHISVILLVLIIEPLFLLIMTNYTTLL